MAGQIIPVTLDDARLAPYLNLKERDLSREGGRFIAEGERVVCRLLESEYGVESLLVSTRRVEAMAGRVPEGVPVYAAPPEAVNQIVGFKFHSGVMAVGVRGRGRTLAEVAASWGDGPALVVVLPQVAKTDNLGSLIRISAGFGADAVILGEQSCDPFYRQAVRVSMGTVFKMPLVRCTNLLKDLAELRSAYGVELAATVLDEDAVDLSRFRRPGRLGLLFGNETEGLSAAEVAACDHRLTIPMKRGTDSLNVSVAAGVFLYALTQGVGGTGQPDS